MALAVVFLLATAFYIWTAATAQPISLYGGETTAYNQLANAFLHFHLWITHIPASELGPEPLNPATRPVILDRVFFDTALRGGYIYLTWGPAPALVLLVPLHLLGYEPSDSMIAAPFAIAGLGFAIAALRVILRQIGDVSLWLCTLAALVLAGASAVPYILQAAGPYFEAVVGGYCFAMAGIWLTLAARVEGRTSRIRLGMASLCFGLAVGSRPTLVLTALALIPVFSSLRPFRRHPGQVAALTLPLIACLTLLAAYNVARFGNPLEVGTQYQISTFYHADWGRLSYVAPGLWSYLITPPRLDVLFPFLAIIDASASYPSSFSAQYASHAEPTSGLLAMAPITLFLVALPWVWRRRPALLGPLGLPLLVIASAGVAILAFLTYYFFGTTERYEVDYTTLLLLGALAVWLALSTKAHGRRRRLVRIGGGLLAAWSCATGFAIASAGQRQALVNVSSPLSTAIATVAGHAILAEGSIAHVTATAPESYTLGATATGFWMARGEQISLTIVSPDNRKIALAENVSAGPDLRKGAALGTEVRGPGHSSHDYQLPTEGEEALIPVNLTKGINHISLRALATATNITNPSEPATGAVLFISSLHLADN